MKYEKVLDKLESKFYTGKEYFITDDGSRAAREVIPKIKDFRQYQKLKAQAKDRQKVNFGKNRCKEYFWSSFVFFLDKYY